MSLLAEAMDDCVLYTESVTEDGYGGYKNVLTEGISFKAAIAIDTSIQARVAEKQGVTGVYTITTSKALVLKYHFIFRRVEDGQFFRVTSKDTATPDSATLNMRVVSAEEYIPKEGEVNG